MPQWQDKVMEPSARETIRKAREADLFAEIRDRMIKSLDWANRIVAQRQEFTHHTDWFPPDAVAVMLGKVYDELKALDEKLKSELSSLPPSPSESEDQEPSPCTGGCR